MRLPFDVGRSGKEHAGSERANSLLVSPVLSFHDAMMSGTQPQLYPAVLGWLPEA